MNVNSIICRNHATDTEHVYDVEMNVRWKQRGLNRWLSGKIVMIDKNDVNTNESVVSVRLDSGKIQKTRAWQLF